MLIAILDAEKEHFLDAFATATPDIRRKTRQTLPISVHPDTVKTAVYIKRLFKVLEFELLSDPNYVIDKFNFHSNLQLKYILFNLSLLFAENSQR